MNRGLITILFIMCSILSSAQSSIIQGIVSDENQQSLEFVSVYIKSTAIGTITNEKGQFSLKIPLSKFPLILNFSRIGYYSNSVQIKSVSELKFIEIELAINSTELPEVNVSSINYRGRNISTIKPIYGTIQTTASSGEIENLIKSLPGVIGNNTLSYQYSVRGGNFDENLIYVNGFEILRPQLIQNSQNEGLSFINSQLVKSIEFSAGGFDAEYGDKMSSVLDIKYQQPKTLSYTIQLGLLGAGFTYKNNFSQKLALLSSARYRSTKYALNYLPEKGDYFPQAFDFQNLLYFTINEHWRVDYLNYSSHNSYQFLPKERESDFGTIQESYNIKIYFDGQESSSFLNLMNATTLNYSKYNFESNIGFAIYNTKETLNQDIVAQYWLNELDKELGSETLGDSTLNLGVGTSINHQRSSLYSNLYNFQWNATLVMDNLMFKSGISYRIEDFVGQTNEWELIDSADYSLPNNTESVELSYSYSNLVEQVQKRFQAYFQTEYNKNVSIGQIIFGLGARFHYLDYTEENLISPRLRIAFKPNFSKDLVFRFSSGIYYQPIYYRELINYSGELEGNIKAQKSIQFVLGNDWDFELWNRPFKLSSELYWKKMPNIIPYEINNLKIQYFPDLSATAYSYGVDLKLSGEFVPGLESWFSLSYLKTEENIADDGAGNVFRPMDQRITANIFFQDYLPGNDSYKMNLNFSFGTGLPYGPPHFPRFMATGRMPSYEQVDLGFSKKIIQNKFSKQKRKHFLFESMWLSAEIHNLLDANNVIGYYWVRVVPNQALLYSSISQIYPVPNYSVGRLYNIKLQIEF